MLREDTTDEPAVRADIMIAKAIIDEPGVYTGMVIDEALVEPQAHAAEGGGTEPKPWNVDSGCSAHFCPNWSEFIEYTPYASPHQISQGDSRVTPSMGEGTMSLTCLVDGKPCTHCRWCSAHNHATDHNYPDTEPRMRRIKTRTGSLYLALL